MHGRKTIGSLAGLCSKKKPAPSANHIEYFFFYLMPAYLRLLKCRNSTVDSAPGASVVLK